MILAVVLIRMITKRDIDLASRFSSQIDGLVTRILNHLSEANETKVLGGKPRDILLAEIEIQREQMRLDAKLREQQLIQEKASSPPPSNPMQDRDPFSGYPPDDQPRSPFTHS